MATAQLPGDGSPTNSTLEELEAQVSQTPTNSQVVRALFKAYAESGQLARAEQMRTRVLAMALSPSDQCVFWMGMAYGYREGKRIPECLTAVQQAIDIKPDASHAYDLLVQVCESDGTLERAVKILQAQTQMQPKHGALWNILAKTHEKMKHWHEAKLAAEAALRVNPDISEAKSILQRVQKQLEAEADKLAQSGEANEKQEQLAQAEKDYRAALRLIPEHRDARIGLQRTQRKQHPPEAWDENAARVLTPAQLGDLYRWLIECQYASRAATFFERYWKKHPESSLAVLFLARTYLETGELERAVATFRIAVNYARKPEDKAATLCELGQVYERLNQLSDAKRAYREALQLVPNHAGALKYLAVHGVKPIPSLTELRDQWADYRASGRFLDAVTEFQKLTQRDPDAPGPYEVLGYAYDALDLAEEACTAAIEAAKRTADKTGNAFVLAAEFCVGHDFYAEAEQCYRQALEIKPGNSKARQQLSNIQEWRSSEERRLKCRQGLDKPDTQYLRALWQYLKQQPSQAESQFHSAAQYFAGLTQTLTDLPILFSLLGQVHEKRRDFKNAALAYQHKTALTISHQTVGGGRSNQYMWLGDFCNRHPEAYALARQAYETAIALNPFQWFAKKQFDVIDGATTASPKYLTGTKDTEDFARDLCDDPADTLAAQRLRERFRQRNDLLHAADTYTQLQHLRPGEPRLVQQYAELCLELNDPGRAWVNIQHTLAHTTSFNSETRKALESLAQRAAAEMAQRKMPAPQYRLPAPDESATAIGLRWHKIAMENAAHFDSVVSNQARAQQAQAHLAEAGKFPTQTKDETQLEHYLFAAEFYHRMEQRADMLDCLIKYGQAMRDYYRPINDEQAQKYAAEALRLAGLHAHPKRRKALLDYLTAYLKALDRNDGHPRRWSDAARAECRAVFKQIRAALPTDLRHPIILIEQMIAALQQNRARTELEDPRYQFVIIQKQLARAEELVHILRGWSDAERPPVQAAPRAHLGLALAGVTPPVKDTREFEIAIQIHNSGQPADCITVTAHPIPDGVVRPPEEFVPFLGSNGDHTIKFHLPEPVSSGQAIQIDVNVIYFDAIGEQTERRQFPVKPIQIFLSYAHDDRERVEKIYQRLEQEGFKPWMDVKSLRPGQKWPKVIPQAIEQSDFFIVFLSANSVDREGQMLKEVTTAMEIRDGLKATTVYLIPARLEPCDPPYDLKNLQWVDLFAADGVDQLVGAIREQMANRSKK